MKFRKGIFSFLILLLAFSPVLGLFADEAEAASSRVAVIQSMKGTVYVKKAGGSKEFKAYAKMSLNEGDVLRTGANSSAVLQFSNGTSEDDRMSVSAGTTLTFSKLSDRNGTRTKVSMFNGTAWVDVKSIATKNDEFTLETPTAVMGVRGTHLLVSVDPLTGATRLTVVAGVVHTQPTGDGEARDVKPGDNALIVKDEQNSGEVVIAPADLDLLMQQSDSSIVEAIVTAAAEIMLENQEKLDQYFEGEGPAGDLERMKSNIENLVGAIVDSAIRNGVITEERANELIAEAQAQTGVTVDLSKKTLNLTEEERLKQEEQKRKQEEAARKAAEELRAKEEQRRQNEELLKRLEEVRKAKEEANRQAEEKRIKNAVEEYKSRLSDAEKQRFEADQQNRAEESSQNQTGSQPGTAPGAPSSDDSDSGSSSGGGDEGDGDQGGGSEEDPVPEFLTGWDTTAGNNMMEWFETSEEDSKTYKLDLATPVQDLQMKLDFDDDLYKIQAIRPHVIAGKQVNHEGEQENPDFEEVGFVIASWNSSGTSNPLPLLEGTNIILLAAFQKNDPESGPVEAAMLMIQNGEPHVSFYVNDQQAGKIGNGSFIAAIPSPSENVTLWAVYPDINYSMTITGDNGAEVEHGEEGSYTITWYSKQGTVTNLSAEMTDIVSGKKKHYTITLVEGNSSSLEMANWKVTERFGDGSVYDSEDIEFETSNVYEREINADSSSILLEPLSEMLESIEYQAYFDGEPLTPVAEDQIEVPLAPGVHEVTVVARPKNGDESSPAAVYLFRFLKAKQFEELEDVLLGGESIFNPDDWQLTAFVPPESGSTNGKGSVTLSIQTSQYAGKWLVYDKQSRDLVHPASQYEYTLELLEGWNEFVLYSTENSDYYPIKIYFGNPALLDQLEFYMLDDSTEEPVFSWGLGEDEFDPHTDNYNIVIDGSEKALPEYVHIDYDKNLGDGFIYSDIMVSVKNGDEDWQENLNTDYFALPPGETIVKLKVIVYTVDEEEFTKTYTFNITRGGSQNPGDPPPPHSGAVPGFLTAWETTAGGSSMEWIGFGDEENPFYKLDLQGTEEIQMKLYFDDSNYKLETYSLYGVEEFYDDYPEGLAQGSWTTSGTSQTLMLETGTNLYLLALYPRNNPEAPPVNKALLMVQNGSLPIHFNLYVQDDQYDIPKPARIGANSFIVPIPSASQVVELYATYNTYDYVPMEVTVTGDNGVIITQVGESDPSFELSWNPVLKNGPVTHLNIQAKDVISGQLQESYTLTLVEGDNTTLQFSSLKVGYQSNDTEVEEYLTIGNIYNDSIGIEDSNVSSISLEPMGNIESFVIEMYHNGKPITDWSNVPIYHIENEFQIVVRHMDDYGPEAPLSVYTAYVYKEYPQDEITDIQIDGESIFPSQDWYSDVLVSQETESVSLTFTTDGSREWLVYDGNKREFVEPEQGQYTLHLTDGWNKFDVYYAGPISCECAAAHSLNIYRGEPAVLNGMELYYSDYSAGGDIVYWDQFDPLIEDYSITIDIPEEQVTPDYLDINVQTPKFAGLDYHVTMSINQETPIDVNGNQINLATGMNTVELKVQAKSVADEQVVDTKTYTFNIDRKPSKNAGLKSVTIAVYGEEYLYDPISDLDIELYEDATEAELVQVEPLDWKSTVQYSINGTELENFTQVPLIPLQPGSNTLKVRIIAENGNYKDYTINIYNPSGGSQ